MQGLFNGALGLVGIAGLYEGLGGAHLHVGIVRVLAQQRGEQLHRLGRVAVVQVHARQRRHCLRVLRALRQGRGEGVVGGHQVALFTQQVGLAHGVLEHQVVVAALVAGLQWLAAQLAQNLVHLHVVAGLEQCAGIGQAQGRGGRAALGNGGAQHAQRMFGLADIDIGRGQRREHAGVVGRCRFGALQQLHGLLALALFGQVCRLAGQQVQFDLFGQGVHGGAALGRGHLRQAALGRLPLAQAAGEQRAGIQRLGPLRVGLEHLVDGLARLAGGIALEVDLRQVVTRPHVLRVVAHGLFQRLASAGQVATALGVAGLAYGDGRAQHAQVAQAFALGIAEPVDQALAFAQLAVLRQHADQPAQRIGVAGIQAQGLAIGGFGAVELTLGGLQVGQADRPLHLARVHRDGALQQLAGVLRIAGVAGGIGLVQQHPVAVALQGALPAAAVATADGLLEQCIGVAQAALALAHDAQPAEGVGILRLLAQTGLERLLGLGQVVGVQRLEAAHQVAVLALDGAGLAGTGTALELVADLFVVRVGLEVGIEQRHLGGARRTQPGQALAPALDRFTADHRVVGIGRQPANALHPRAFVAQQQLGQVELDLGVVRRLALQALQALARFLPAGGGVAQVAVELQAQFALGCTATEQRAVCRHGLIQLARFGELAGLLQLRGVIGAVQGDLLLQQQGLTLAGVRLPELVEVALGALRAIAIKLQQAKAVQRVGLLRIDQQQLAPCLGGAGGVFAGLPVLTLFQQDLAVLAELGKAAVVDQGGKHPNG